MSADESLVLTLGLRVFYLETRLDDIGWLEMERARSDRDGIDRWLETYLHDENLDGPGECARQS